jgi:Zn-dependent M28 family amino/carboxypeptidase
MKRYALPLLFACTTACGLVAAALPDTAPAVDPATLRAHLAFISSDLFEGRGTGQRGADLTVAYLETQAAVLGLQPAGEKGYRQAVPLVGMTPTTTSTLGIHIAGRAANLRFGSDWVWASAVPEPVQRFDHEVVFVGYGIRAAEENWDDFKDVDVRGKILLMLTEEPPPTAAEPNLFDGGNLTFYGRRDYKAQEAMRRGARGVIAIHRPERTIASWSLIADSAALERFHLANEPAALPLGAVVTHTSARAWFAAAGLDPDQIFAKAETRAFRPVALPVRLQGELKQQVRQLTQYNIAAAVPGSDPVLKNEWVIYSAHWDHLGIKPAEPGQSGGDRIYNGAVDNGSGTSALLAMAQAAIKQPAKRSQLFLWVAAEEQGLLGSAYYASKPLFPLARTAAALNLDTLNFAGPTRDIGLSGSERSDLGEHARAVAAAMQLQPAPPRVDAGGGFFRSDHFSFVQAGVPAFSIWGGTQYVDQQDERAAQRKQFGGRYHQLSDEYNPKWDLGGMVQQAQFTLNLGWRVANAASLPQWKAGDPFGKVRSGAKPE